MATTAIMQALSGKILLSEAAADLGLSHAALRGYSHRYGFGQLIGRRLFFTPEEVAAIAKLTDRRAKNVRKGRDGHSIPREIEIRPELLAEGLKQASKLDLTLDQYLQLLIYDRASAGWQKRLRPPLQF